MNQMTPVDDGAAARRHALEEAIQRAGGIVRFAKAMRVSLQAVTLWRRQHYVPLTRAVEIEQRYHVPRESLVPPGIAAVLATPRSPSSDVL